MEYLSLGRTQALVPEFAVKDLLLGRTLMMMMTATMVTIQDGAKGDWDFRIFDLVNNPIFNTYGEFR